MQRSALHRWPRGRRRRRRSVSRRWCRPSGSSRYPDTNRTPRPACSDRRPPRRPPRSASRSRCRFARWAWRRTRCSRLQCRTRPFRSSRVPSKRARPRGRADRDDVRRCGGPIDAAIALIAGGGNDRNARVRPRRGRFAFRFGDRVTIAHDGRAGADRGRNRGGQIAALSVDFASLTTSFIADISPTPCRRRSKLVRPVRHRPAGYFLP